MEAGLFGESFLWNGEVFAFAGINQYLKDLKEGSERKICRGILQKETTGQIQDGNTSKAMRQLESHAPVS